jgi:phenylpropionate dioxygenase-like ring-hydroxylating dioxygenase large terminal subunit
MELKRNRNETVAVAESDLDLAAVPKSVERAHGLPNAFYTDPEIWEEEKRKVFLANWACVGFGKDVPLPGDLMPLEFLGIPLLLARDKSGGVRVFQNVCRHRGMILVQKPKRANIITCPYHAWCYRLDGSLKGTPHLGGPGVHKDPRIDPKSYGLFEVRSHVWMDMIFVNLSGEAPDFLDYAAHLIARWREFESRPLVHGGPESTLTFELDSNWKLAVENFCESYHLPVVHPSLNTYSRLEDHYHIQEPGHFSGQGTTVYNPQLDESGRAFALFPGLSSKWERGAEYIALYPNVLLGVHKDHTFAIRIDPLGQIGTRETVEIYYADPGMAGPDWADLRAANAETWRGVFAEDVGVVEGMQEGRRAPAFDGGVFSPAMDGPTQCFHQWVAGCFRA